MSTTVDDVRRALARGASAPEHSADHAAVAAILLPLPVRSESADRPGAELLFIRRAEVAGDPWSGHVAFPGGRMQKSDPDALATAIRETEEEIGVALGPASYVGPLDPLRPISNMPLVVHPFVFALEGSPPFRPNREVASLHRLSIDALLAGAGRGEMPFHWGGRDHVLPCVDFDGVRLWGMTLRIVDELLHRLDGRGHGLERPRWTAP